MRISRNALYQNPVLSLTIWLVVFALNFKVYRRQFVFIDIIFIHMCGEHSTLGVQKQKFVESWSLFVAGHCSPTITRKISAQIKTSIVRYYGTINQQAIYSTYHLVYRENIHSNSFKHNLFRFSFERELQSMLLYFNTTIES